MDRNKKKKDVLNHFLTGKRYKYWRHTALILITAVIAVNGVFGVYSENLTRIGNWIKLAFLLSSVLYIVTVYLNLYFLVPKLLLQNKYVQYIIALFILISIFILSDFSIELIMHKRLNIPLSTSSAWSSPRNFVIEFIMIFVICLTLLTGLSMIELYKSWSMHMQLVNTLKNKRLQTELEVIKEQIDPAFLSKILKKTAELAISEPQQASDILLKLGRTLRYQLYDCSRNKVLLVSEIEFLTNYLNIEKIFEPSFEYRVSKIGNLNHVFIPPLLFLSIIQKHIIQIRKLEGKSILHILFEVEKDQLQFHCINDKLIKNIEYEVEKYRLEFLFKDQYVIHVQPHKGLIIQVNI